MALSQRAKLTIEALKLSKVPYDDALAIMLAIYRYEDSMLELIDYMVDEHPTTQQIIDKGIDIACRLAREDFAKRKTKQSDSAKWKLPSIDDIYKS